MRRSIDYEGLAVLESADIKQPVDIKIHVTSAHVDPETTSASEVHRPLGAIEVWVKDDVMDLLVEIDTLTILARSPVGGFAVVTDFHLDTVERLAATSPDTAKVSPSASVLGA